MKGRKKRDNNVWRGERERWGRTTGVRNSSKSARNQGIDILLIADNKITTVTGLQLQAHEC